MRLLMVGEGEWGGPKLRPWEVRKLTLTEIALMVSPAEKKTSGGGRNMSDAEIAMEVAWYKSLTVQEKIAYGKAGMLG